MERVWAPWRIQYILDKKPQGCIFCLGDESDDGERLVLYRGRHSFAIMNRYPYVNGHLMAAPYRHTAEPDDLSPEENLDLWETVLLCRSALRTSVSPEGYNIGMNLGRTAGAGVLDHLHIHIVPRWNGDTSFMSVIDDVRVIPEGLAEMYRRLVPLFPPAGAGR